MPIGRLIVVVLIFSWIVTPIASAYFLNPLFGLDSPWRTYIFQISIAAEFLISVTCFIVLSSFPKRTVGRVAVYCLVLWVCQLLLYAVLSNSWRKPNDQSAFTPKALAIKLRHPEYSIAKIQANSGGVEETYDSDHLRKMQTWLSLLWALGGTCYWVALHCSFAWWQQRQREILVERQPNSIVNTQMNYSQGERGPHMTTFQGSYGATGFQNGGSSSQIDVGIIVPLQEEFRELYEELPASNSIKDDDTGTTDYLFERAVESGTPYRCAATFVGTMGPTEAALATERFIVRRKPTTVVVLGIAAGISDDIKLCDVLVARHIGRYLDSAKIVADGKVDFDIKPGGDSFPCSQDLVRACLDFEFAHGNRFSQWQQLGAINQQDHISDTQQRQQLHEKGWLSPCPSFLQGTVASGPVVASAEAFVKWVKDVNRNYAALEMEGGGVLAAVYSRADPKRSLMLRGISDFGDHRKKMLDKIGKGGIRRNAMRNAVHLLWGLMEANILPRGS